MNTRAHTDSADSSASDGSAPGNTHPEGPASAAEPTPPDGGFAGVARLELDELLIHLIARATDVQRTQGRLRGLLRAYMQVARAADLEEVLPHILDAARTLVGARYAALGVIEDGRMVRFLHTGMDAATVRAVGVQPEGKGLLGRLIDYPEPLRLRDIAEHMTSIGFPPHHPPMRSFLGVPIRIGEQVFGNLYLADKPGAEEFSADDEELATALAVAAGVAIGNAALLHQSRRRQRWQTAMTALSTAILSNDDPVEFALPQIVVHATSASSPAGVCICVPTEQPGMLRVAAGNGVYTERIGMTFPIAGSVYADALANTGPVIIADQDADPRTAAHPIKGAGQTVALPMRSDAAITGVLSVCNTPGAGPFDRLDLELLGAYASHAALVLQLAHAHHDNARLLAANDRQQIAEDLHRHVLHSVSRLGIDLHGIAARLHDSTARATVMAKIDDTDTIIHELRSAIFSLHPSDTTSPVTVAEPAQAR
ncbi:GAF domain-containing protein [Micromonosporaceae bacterium Da 78-11]